MYNVIFFMFDSSLHMYHRQLNEIRNCRGASCTCRGRKMIKKANAKWNKRLFNLRQKLRRHKRGGDTTHEENKNT